MLMVPENSLNSERYWSKLSLSSNLRFSECQLTSIHCLGARACHSVSENEEVSCLACTEFMELQNLFMVHLGHPSPNNDVCEVLKTV